jgi:hypothetical protein
MKNSSFIIGCLLLMCYSCNYAQEKVSLQLLLKKNDTYRVTIPMSMPTEISIELDEQKMKNMFVDALGTDDTTALGEEKNDTSAAPKIEKVNMEMNMELALIFKVLNAEKEGYKLEAFYEYMETGVTAKEEKAFYSTRKKNTELSKEQQDELRAVKSTIGKKFYLLISNTGQLKELIGYEKVVSGLTNKSKNDNPFGSNESLLVQQLDKSEISNTIRGIFDILPEQPVKTGDSWSKEYPVEDNRMPYMIRTKYTLKEISKTAYRILSESIIFSDTMKKQMAQVSGLGKGEITLLKTDNLQQTQPYSLDMNIDMEFLGMMMKTSSKISGVYKIEKL